MFSAVLDCVFNYSSLLSLLKCCEISYRVKRLVKRRFTNLYHLNLTSLNNSTLISLSAILPYCCSLTTLSFNNVNIPSLLTLSSFFPSLSFNMKHPLTPRSIAHKISTVFYSTDPPFNYSLSPHNTVLFVPNLLSHGEVEQFVLWLENQIVCLKEFESDVMTSSPLMGIRVLNTLSLHCLETLCIGNFLLTSLVSSSSIQLTSVKYLNILCELSDQHLHLMFNLSLPNLNVIKFVRFSSTDYRKIKFIISQEGIVVKPLFNIENAISTNGNYCFIFDYCSNELLLSLVHFFQQISKKSIFVNHFSIENLCDSLIYSLSLNIKNDFEFLKLPPFLSYLEITCPNYPSKIISFVTFNCCFLSHVKINSKLIKVRQN
ncbi:hypothetical protein P9112_004506 [Eukaryota sp. TZLM1-RC]